MTAEDTLAQDGVRATRWPGLLVALVAALVAVGVAPLLPSISPLLVAIVLGVLVANTMTMPASLLPGLAVASTSVLRWGIVLLGLRISIEEIVDLGWRVVAVAVVVVGLGMVTAWFAGAALKIGPAQRLLIGAGFSICGAAAVERPAGSSAP